MEGAGPGGWVFIKLSSPSPQFTPNMGSSLEAQQFMHPLDPTLNVASVTLAGL